MRILDQFLKQFRDVPSSDLELINQFSEEKKFAPGQALLNQNSTAHHLYFILNGILKITTVNDKGSEVIQFFVKENRFCTILYSFNNNTPSTESIVAAVETQVLSFAKTDLEKLYLKLPYLKELIENITKQALLDKIKLRNSYMGEEATTRYLKFIEQQPDIMYRVALSDVASYLGITQQSLSRIRRKIAQQKK